MKTIVKQEIKNYLKNPILWLGIIVILAQLFQILNPYLQLHYFASEQEIQKLTLEPLEPEEVADVSILDGYLSCTEEERRELALQLTEQYLIQERKLPKEQVQSVIQNIRQKNTVVDKIDEELDCLFGEAYENEFFVFDYYYNTIARVRKADLDEANSYIRKKMEDHSYSWYFARKFADFSGLFLGFFSVILLAFLFLRDSRKDMYELLHTKPIKPISYVNGKIAGGFSVMLMVWGIFTILFGLLCEVHGKNAGLPVNIFDFVLQAVIYILPNMLMITCVYAMIALIFKNPLPAAPLLVLYMLYSNMGSRDAEGNYGYFGRPLAIMVRFPGDFLETTPPPMAAMNQTFLLIASGVIVALSVFVWNRRRVYQMGFITYLNSIWRIAGACIRMMSCTARCTPRSKNTRGVLAQEIKICLPGYKLAYSIVFVVLLSIVRGITTIDEIGLSIEPYQGLLAIVFCADTYLCEWNEKRGEVFSMISIGKRGKVIYRRLMIQILYLWLVGAVGYFFFFWQHPYNDREISMIQEYGWYLFALMVTILFWSTLAMTITNLLRSSWAGIGGSIMLWLMLYSKGGEEFFGKYNVFSYVFRDLNQTCNLDWVWGEIVGMAGAVILLVVVPVIIKKRG